LVDAGIASCPGGNPVQTGTTLPCTTCSGSTPVPCPNGGCYPGNGYNVITTCYAGSSSATCGYCAAGQSVVTSDCTGTSFNLVCSSSSSSSTTSSCFSGSETLTLSSGETVPMDQVKIGDQVQVASMDGKTTSFSPVIAIPHPINSEKASFIHLTTETGRDVRMTRDHLVMGGVCGATVNSLKEASSLKPTDCLMTISGEEVITTVSSAVSAGVYTVVTASNGLLVVNGVIASPFASNHHIPNAFYNIHRALYKFAPGVVSHPTVAKVIQAFGNLMIHASGI